MKNDIADILFKYTTGEATLEETNDALKEAEAGFNLEPGRNEITPDEMALTTVGDTPEEANGFGLLDTGTGSMEKVHVTNGKLDEAINQVNHDGTTNMLAFVIIGPNRYEVKGDTLTDCYGSGSKPRGYGTGNYKASGKLSMLRDDYDDLLAYCKQKGVPFYKMELPSIIVSYANEGARTKIDELKKVKFSKRSNKAAQGDKSLTVDVDMMIVGGVYQDGVAPV